MQEQIHIETLIKEVEELYQRLLDDRYALGEGRYAQMVMKPIQSPIGGGSSGD